MFNYIATEVYACFATKFIDIVPLRIRPYINLNKFSQIISAFIDDFKDDVTISEKFYST